jgi:hypothetical protein
MPEYKEDEIKAALSTAKDARRKYSTLLRQAEMSARSRKLGLRRNYSEKFVGPVLAKAGLGVDELNKLGSQTQAEMRRLLEEQKADLIKRIALGKDVLQSEADSWRKAKERLVSLRSENLLLGFNFVVLDTPLFIWASQGIDSFTASKAPWNNVAKISSGWASYNVNDVSFIFVWQNPSDKYAVINAESYLTLNGSSVVAADSAFFGLQSNISWIELRVYFNILEYWNKPPTTPPFESTQLAYALDLGANGGWLGDYEVAMVNGTYDVRYDQFVLAPLGVAIFEVSLVIETWTDGGFTEIDFASGNFEVICPGLLIGILT